MLKQLELIIPTIKEDFLRTKRDLNSFFKLLPISEIIFIGPGELKEYVEEEKKKYSERESISFLNENDVLSFARVSEAMKTRLLKDGYSMDGNSRPGWYYQQFLKMAFSERSKGEYYMSWDADTVPLRKIEMLGENGKPYFDIKPEYNPGYFKTIRKLFNIERQLDSSFISEHMIFSRHYMKELIAEIEGMDIYGDSFYEKLFYAIDINNMKWGFSEFETYGNWMLNRHPQAYELREWHSMRMGGYFLDSSKLDGEDIKWLSTDFDAISFEGYNKVVPELSEAFYNKDYRARFSAGQFYTMLLENEFLGEYKDGMIKGEGGVFFPV